MLHNRPEVIEYVRKKLGITEGDLTVDETTGVVDVVGNVGIEYTEPLQVQFGKVVGHFSVKDPDGQTIVPELTFKGFPRVVTGCFSLFGSSFKDMSGINKEVTFVTGDIVLNPDAVHLLGVLAIGGTGKIDYDRGPVDKIFDKYRETGDVLAAQDEMIEGGHKAQARF